MTFTVMGRDPETGAIGVGLTTASVNCGRVAPHVKDVLPELTERGVVVASQSMCNPLLAYRAFELLDRGASFEEIQRDFEGFDEHLAYRQVGILRATGEVWAYTGSSCFPEKGHVLGESWLVMGNALAAATLPAMAEAYEAGAGLDLAERLMRTLEVGRDAGGQAWQGERIPEFFASLLVLDGRHPYPAVDLRVDFDVHALEKLRRLLDHTREGGDRYFETFYRRPDEFDSDTMAWAFELARYQV